MISLAMIVKASDEEAISLDRCLQSVANYVNEICITITGDNKKVEEVAKKYGARISHFDWVDDFSAARAFNFSQCKGEWILWLDADDTIEGAVNLKKYVDLAKHNPISGYAFAYHYAHDENGNPTDIHWKVQFVKNDGHCEWKGAIHEDLIQKRTVQWSKVEDIIRVHNTNEVRTQESSERNLRILLKEVERIPNDPRPKFYLARTYVALGEFDKAIPVIDEYLTLSGWDEERYEARLLKGQCHFHSGRNTEALEAYNRAILEKEEYPDAYLMKAAVYLKMEEWKKAIANYTLSGQLDLPSGYTYFNPFNYTRNMFLGLATAYMNLGEFDKAWKSVQTAYKYDPDYSETHYLIEIIKSMKNEADATDAYIRVSQYLQSLGEEEKIPAVLGTVPNALADDPKILKVRQMYNKPKKWKKNEIAIMCGWTDKCWDGNSVNAGGIGGSETAIVELAKRLAEKGWKVTVFNHSDADPKGTVIDGVKYMNTWTFNPFDEFNVLWLWRSPVLVDHIQSAKSIVIDMHDVPIAGDFTEERLKKINKIFVKSKYHRNLLPDVPDNKFVIVGNGIDLDRFKDEGIEREPHRFIYSSTPDRGLETILDMWPRIRAKMPDATLHVYYGWETFYDFQKNNPERMAWMKKVQEKMKQDGVVDHGRVGQDILAKDMMKSTFWLYPTDFPEIHCITACEMQAAGVIPITSGYAALEETQQTGVKIPTDDVGDTKWQDQLIDKIVELDGTTLPTDVAKQFDWDLVANVWNDELL